MKVLASLVERESLREEVGLDQSLSTSTNDSSCVRVFAFFFYTAVKLCQEAFVMTSFSKVII